jgi:hypothetical protein
LENSGKLPLNQQTNPPNPAQIGKQSASANRLFGLLIFSQQNLNKLMRNGTAKNQKSALCNPIATARIDGHRQTY